MQTQTQTYLPNIPEFFSFLISQVQKQEEMRTLLSVDDAAEISSASEPTMNAQTAQQHERAVLHPAAPGWHSPVPYLFGGLAAMLGLIAFALLVLACSYWKLSGTSLEPREGDHSTRDRQEGNSTNNNNNNNMSSDHRCHLELKHVVVIMAGEEKPTFLATPIFSSRASSFGDRSNSTTEEINENQNHA